MSSMNEALGLTTGPIYSFILLQHQISSVLFSNFGCNRELKPILCVVCVSVCVRVCVRACVAAAAALCAQGLHSSQVIYVCVCLQSCVISHVHVGPLRCHSSLPDIHMCTKKNITGLGCQNPSACSRASSNCPQHHPSIWRTSRGEYLYCK